MIKNKYRTKENANIMKELHIRDTHANVFAYGVKVSILTDSGQHFYTIEAKDIMDGIEKRKITLEKNIQEVDTKTTAYLAEFGDSGPIVA